MAYLKEFVHVFKGKFVWQFNPRTFELNEDFPKRVSAVFLNLPKRFEKIDAMYQIPFEDEIVVFSGKEYITYDIRGETKAGRFRFRKKIIFLSPLGPIYTAYNITRYTYDDEIEKIDAAMVWCKNSFQKFVTFVKKSYLQPKTTKLICFLTIAFGSTLKRDE